MFHIPSEPGWKSAPPPSRPWARLRGLWLRRPPEPSLLRAPAVSSPECSRGSSRRYQQLQRRAPCRRLLPRLRASFFNLLRAQDSCFQHTTMSKTTIAGFGLIKTTPLVLDLEAKLP